MKNTCLLLIAVCFSFSIRFLDLDSESVQTMSYGKDTRFLSVTLTDLADDIFERSLEK